ncbi:regulatory signaling modulator protein AmpE [Cognatilysobacter bugurensis]|nr:regulatory signaling modulator protein AmpE [Lysobacter bugurensis]
MSAALIAVVVVLLLMRAAPSLVKIRRFAWFSQALSALGARLGEGSHAAGHAALAVAVVVPVVLIAAVHNALENDVFGLPALLLGIGVLFYAWGPRDLEHDVEAVADASDTRQRREAAAHLWPPGHTPVLAGGALVEAVFRCALRRQFAVLLWFVLLGPAGALGYRLIERSVDGEPGSRLADATRRVARRVLAWLDWPAAQLIVFALALVGHFDAVLGAWRRAGGASLRPDHGFLTAAARASVRCELDEDRADALDDESPDSPPPATLAAREAPELRDALGLVWRCLLAWLAALALFVIGGWVS